MRGCVFHTRYDSNGNCTSVTVGSGMSAVTANLSYDYESRVSGITFPSSATNSFKYNGNDLRVQKIDSSGTRNYITDGDGCVKTLRLAREARMPRDLMHSALKVRYAVANGDSPGNIGHTPAPLFLPRRWRGNRRGIDFLNISFPSPIGLRYRIPPRWG